MKNVCYVCGEQVENGEEGMLEHHTACGSQGSNDLNGVSRVIENLYNTLLELNGTEAHMQFEQVYNNAESFAVVSVYNRQTPSHKILSDLIEWAEKEGKDDVLAKIEELSDVKANGR